MCVRGVAFGVAALGFAVGWRIGEREPASALRLLRLGRGMGQLRARRAAGADARRARNTVRGTCTDAWLKLEVERVW